LHVVQRVVLILVLLYAALGAYSVYRAWVQVRSLELRVVSDDVRPGIPALVDVTTARQELSIPPAITAEQAKGFTLYAIRTILAGRADELLDLVTTNVARRILD